MLHSSSMHRLALAATLVLLTDAAHAVPAFQQLYRRHAKAAVASCLVCHQGGAGGKLNDYGRDFMKAGANLKAFTALDGTDSDGDGAKNADEARAGSNPGDPASTPKKPGAWAAGIKPEDTLPLDDLADLFPQAARFEVKEYELTAADLAAVGAALDGVPLGPEDAVATLFFPVDTKATPPTRVGVALFSAESTPDGLLLTAVGLGADGRVVKALGALYGPTGRDSLKELGKQLTGRSSESPLRIGTDLKPMKGRKKLGEAGARAFRKDLLMIAQLLAGGH